MKKPMMVSGSCVLGVVAALAVSGAVNANDLVYSHEFLNGVSYCPGDAQYDDWLTYRASLPTSGVTSITISGSQDPVGRTCSDPVTAQQIADAMRTGMSLSVACGGFTWEVAGLCQEGGCVERDNDLVLSAGGCTCCSCDSTYILRPGVGNSNWGGILSGSCDQPTQTMTVTVTTESKGSTSTRTPVSSSPRSRREAKYQRAFGTSSPTTWAPGSSA